MGRKMRMDPAVCFRCNADFECSGKMRYQHLNRHMKNVHGITDTRIVTDDAKIINNITYSNCVINNNINVFDSTVRKLLKEAVHDEEFMQKFIKYAKAAQCEYISACDAAVCLFDKIHCNPEHPEACIAVIPNVSRNTMLVREPEGKFESFSKNDGAKKALSIFEDNTLPILKTGFVEPVSKAFQGVENENMNRQLQSKLVKKMEGVDKTTRKEMTKKISDNSGIP